MSATLQVLSGPEAGCRYEFGETEILIGRDENCSVVLHSRAISRRHARLYFQSDRYWLEYYSRGPVLVNGRTVESHKPVALADGDRIGICDSLLEFRCALPVADDE